MNNFRIMTLNMLTDGLYNYGDSRFSRRVCAIEEMIRIYEPDLIGTQEMTEHMIPLLHDTLETYALIGESRHSMFANEYSAVLYKKERFELLKEQTFWLSTTPLKTGSKFLLSQFPRIVTFAVFRDRSTGMEFSFFNTHLDQNFAKIRFRQADILRGLIRENQTGSFTVLTGDFNDVPGSQPLLRVCSAGLKDTSDLSLGSTLRGRIGSAIQKNRPIDHILLSEGISSYNVTKIDQKFCGCWPGDHYPLLCELSV